MAARLTAYIVATIVAVTLIAGLIVGAQRDEGGPADLIIFNARIYTAREPGTFAQAVGIRGNQILRVGSTREVRRLGRWQTTMIDARGRAVLPGFNDAHVHLVSGGLGLERLSLLDAATVDEIRERIRAYAEANPDRPWILGRGWYYEPFPGGLPTRQQLDALVPDRPAYLVAYDGHTGWANTQALQLAGITRRTRNPPNGVVVRDRRTGEPTGVLKEAAQALMDTVLPPVTREERLRAIRAAIGEAHRMGVTSMQDAGTSEEDVELYDEIRRAGDLKVRVYAALSGGVGLTEADADRLELIRQKYADDPTFKIGAIELVADGAVEPHTAALLQPYANRSTKGQSTCAPEEFGRIVTLLDRRGWQISTHAAGDAAIRMALDAYEQAAVANPAPPRGRRHRIEHAEIIDPADTLRAGRVGLIASMQPFRGNPSQYQVGLWAANLGPERASRGWAYRSIRESGGRIAFGSDWPANSLDPRLGLHVAVNRTTPDGEPADGWYPEQKLSRAAAIDAYTRDAAYASFDEQRKGMIAPGMLADLVILSRDIFSLPPEQILDAEVDVTIFNGQVVYRRERQTTEP